MHAPARSTRVKARPVAPAVRVALSHARSWRPASGRPRPILHTGQLPAVAPLSMETILGGDFLGGTAPPVQPSAMPLTWALAIATYNRPEALRQVSFRALEQTRPPCEIIIVDSSPSQPSSQQDIQDLVLQSGANVRVHYLRSPIAQQTIQRNLAIDALRPKCCS